jgi:HEAT repeat protein
VQGIPNKRWLIVAGIAVALAVAAALVWSPSEPEYHGKPLRFWLQAFDPTYRSKPPGYSTNAMDEGPTRDEAETAIRAIGTNALPSLLRMIAYHPNPLEIKLRLLILKLPSILRVQPTYLNPNSEALMAFYTLGTNAGPAVPQLIEICNRESDQNTRFWVLAALGSIGPPAKAAIPMLLGIASGTNSHLREGAVVVLGDIHSDAADVVPTLILCLGDPDPKIRLDSVLSLQKFGEDAKLAGPALLELLRDPKRRAGPVYAFKGSPGAHGQSPSVGEMATNALWEVDPALARKAGMADRW